MRRHVASAVELGHQLAVRGAGGREVVALVLELELQVDDLLFEGGDPGLKLFGVVGAADAGLALDPLAQGIAEAGFKAADLGGEAGGAGVGGRQVGLERRPADGRPPAAGDRGRLSGLGMDLAEEVTVAVEEGAVNARGAGDRRDAGLGAVLRGLGQGGEDPLTASACVGSPAFQHGLDCGVGRGHAGRSGRRSGRGCPLNWCQRGPERPAGTTAGSSPQT
jgi:hypothetical protein